MKFEKVIIQGENPSLNQVIENVAMTVADSTMVLRTLKEDEFKIKFIAEVTSLEIGDRKIYIKAYVDTCRWKFEHCTGIKKLEFTFQ